MCLSCLSTRLPGQFAEPNVFGFHYLRIIKHCCREVWTTRRGCKSLDGKRVLSPYPLGFSARVGRNCGGLRGLVASSKA